MAAEMDEADGDGIGQRREVVGAGVTAAAAASRTIINNGGDDDDIFGSVLTLDEDTRREGYALGLRDGEQGRDAAGPSRQMVEEAYESGRRLGSHAGECIQHVARLVAQLRLGLHRRAAADGHSSRGKGNGDGGSLLTSVEKMLVGIARMAARERAEGEGAALEDAVMALLMNKDLIRLYHESGEPVPEAIHDWRSGQRSQRQRQHSEQMASAAGHGSQSDDTNGDACGGPGGGLLEW